MSIQVQELIQRTMLEHTLPSVVVAVSRGTEIVWEAAYGWADRERGIPATSDTAYSLASISKPATTTGLMVLVERGLIDLDRPINDYLGEDALTGRAGDAAGATVRRVANHTAGLSLHYQFFYADEARLRPPMSETIRRYGNLVTAPGERYMYSNLGFGILDYLIERVADMPFADFMRNEVFLPLGMFHSAIDIPTHLEPFAATRYAADGLPIPFYTFDHPGASAVYSSAHDLLRFGMFHLGHRLPDQKPILSDSARAEMQRITTPAGPTRGYGVGWRMLPDDMGYVSVGHDGGMGGVRTSLRMLPSEGIVAVALTNSSIESPIVPYGLPEELFASVLPEYATRYSARRAAGFVPGLPELPEPPPFQPADDLIGEWHGTVHTMSGTRPLELSIGADGTVIARYNEQLRSLVNTPAIDDGQLIGYFLGDIQTADWEGMPHHLLLDLRLRGDVLSGGLIAQTARQDSGRSGKRVGHALNHWTELRRATA